MALSYKSRKKLALLILLIGVPLYIVLSVNLIDMANAKWGRLPLWAELLVFIGIGVLWITPLRGIFKGIGQADPDEKP